MPDIFSTSNDKDTDTKSTMKYIQEKRIKSSRNKKISFLTVAFLLTCLHIILRAKRNKVKQGYAICQANHVQIYET